MGQGGALVGVQGGAHLRAVLGARAAQTGLAAQEAEDWLVEVLEERRAPDLQLQRHVLLVLEVELLRHLLQPDALVSRALVVGEELHVGGVVGKGVERGGRLRLDAVGGDRGRHIRSGAVRASVPLGSVDLPERDVEGAPCDLHAEGVMGRPRGAVGCRGELWAA